MLHIPPASAHYRSKCCLFHLTGCPYQRSRMVLLSQLTLINPLFRHHNPSRMVTVDRARSLLLCMHTHDSRFTLDYTWLWDGNFVMLYGLAQAHVFGTNPPKTSVLYALLVHNYTCAIGLIAPSALLPRPSLLTSPPQALMGRCACSTCAIWSTRPSSTRT